MPRRWYLLSLSYVHGKIQMALLLACHPHVPTGKWRLQQPLPPHPPHRLPSVCILPTSRDNICSVLTGYWRVLCTVKRQIKKIYQDKIKSEAALQTAVFSGRLPLFKLFNFLQHVSYDWSKCYGFVN